MNKITCHSCRHLTGVQWLTGPEDDVSTRRVDMGCKLGENMPIFTMSEEFIQYLGGCDQYVPNLTKGENQ